MQCGQCPLGREIPGRARVRAPPGCNPASRRIFTSRDFKTSSRVPIKGALRVASGWCEAHTPLAVLGRYGVSWWCNGGSGIAIRGGGQAHAWQCSWLHSRCAGRRSCRIEPANTRSWFELKCPRFSRAPAHSPKRERLHFTPRRSGGSRTPQAHTLARALPGMPVTRVQQLRNPRTPHASAYV